MLLRVVQSLPPCPDQNESLLSMLMTGRQPIIVFTPGQISHALNSTNYSYWGCIHLKYWTRTFATYHHNHHYANGRFSITDVRTYGMSVYTGWRPVVAAYQWWPFSFCTGNYVFVASQIRQFCEGKQKESPQKRLVKFFVWEAKSKHFPQATHMQTSRHFRGTTVHQTFKYRNKHYKLLY